MDIGADYWETSAKDNEGITQLFESVGHRILRNVHSLNSRKSAQSISLHIDKKKRSTTCCP
jgi:hypothetical protein